MTTLGTANKEGVRVSYSIDFDGTSKRFEHGDIISVSDLNNSGDSLDSKRKISDLTFSVYDADNTLWGQIGHGTTAFGKPVSMKVFVGGTYGNLEKPNGTEVVWQGTQGANDYTVHTGSVVSVKKSNKLITFRSENKLNKIKYLKWQPPVRTEGEDLINFYGSYAFYDLGSVASADMWEGTLVPHCLYDITEDGRGGMLWASTSNGFVEASYQGTGIYDTTGTGIADFIASGFEFLDTSYFNEYPPVKFKGTFFGTYIGTITTEESAKSFGYDDLANASSDNTAVGGAVGTYTPNRIRVEFSETINSTFQSIYELQKIKLTGDPIAVARHCLFGKMVSDFLDESTDMGNTFAESQKSVAFQVYDNTFTLERESVVTGFNNMLETTNSIFFVNSNNQFEMNVYGPQDLTQNLDLIGTGDVIKSSFSNNINDWHNRVVIKYGYDYQKEEYFKERVGTLDSWQPTDDRTLTLESVWIKSDNQASNLLTKTLKRMESTVPEYNIETSLKYSGNELGSLISFEDPNTVTGTKILQLVEYGKSFSDGKRVVFRGYDGEALYRKKSYGKWTSGTLGENTGTDRKGAWSDAPLGATRGTVNNINQNFTDGTSFIYW